MPSKTFHLSGAVGVIAIGNHPMNQNAVSNPTAYLSELNFHSALPYMTIKQIISLGAMNIAGTAPSYSFDEPHYTTIQSSMQSVGSTTISNPLFFLVVNGVTYPGGYIYNRSSSGFSKLFLIKGGSGIWLVTQHTSYESSLPAVYLSSVEVLIIG